MKNKYIFVLTIIFLVGCEYGRMYDQPNPRPSKIVQQKIPKNIVKSSIMNKGKVLTINPYLSTDTNLIMGAKVYRQFCYHCHGADWKGNTPVGYGFPVPPTDLNLLSVKTKPDSEFYSHIYYGGKFSPALGAYMSDEEIWKVILYIRKGRN
ncbi:MAG: Cytochrome C oxidase, cbb3-type, subunit III [Ignavibacteriae bacterium]|nr:MAG: Cytochrome C oxidase, cbb3-type, subunit III [Ignavibacteriota bacterium]